MNSTRKLNIFLLFLGDILLLYLSLHLTLLIRYPEKINEAWLVHWLPFSYIYLVWLIIFYIADLYDLQILGSFKRMLERLFKAMPAAVGFAIIIFYLVSELRITPKTNLLINIIILTPLLVLWRKTFWYLVGKISKIKTLFFGTSKESRDLIKQLKLHPRLGYEPTIVLNSIEHNIIDLVKNNNIQIIVASKNVLKNNEAVKRFYEALPLGISVVSFENFYESIAEKIPVYLINEEWFLENSKEINKKTFEKLKRFFDIAGTIILGIPTLIILPFLAILIKLETKGPVFYHQKRLGKDQKIFEIAKFRTMEKNAEKNGPQWSEKNDPRITKVGRILRKSRLDELPQLWNVLKGDLSFIGPRPERPEFVENLEKEIPHYAMRHLIKPGLSGWAQVKFRYGASVGDAMEKLQYDLYYIKNRSLVLDLAIAAKTLAVILGRGGY